MDKTHTHAANNQSREKKKKKKKNLPNFLNFTKSKRLYYMICTHIPSHLIQNKSNQVVPFIFVPFWPSSSCAFSAWTSSLKDTSNTMAPFRPCDVGPS